jgi:cytochrome c biogenesis protein CcdA
MVFAIGTGLPVLIFTYLLAFSAGRIGIFHTKITKVEKVMRLVAGVVFIITGIYYISIFIEII